MQGEEDVMVTPKSGKRFRGSTPSRLFDDHEDESYCSIAETNSLPRPPPSVQDLQEEANSILRRQEERNRLDSPDNFDDDSESLWNMDKSGPNAVCENTRNSFSSQFSRVHVLDRVPAGPYVSVTSSEGERVYLRLRDGGADSVTGKKGGHQVKGIRTWKHLLTVPFSQLKARVEEEVGDRVGRK